MRIFLFLVFLLVTLNQLFAQDTLVAKDGTSLFGEIKEMDRGTIIMETSFSDDDFKITWLEVKQIVSSRKFRFTLVDGTRLYGTITIDTNTRNLKIQDKIKGAIVVPLNKLVYLKQVDQGSFLDLMNLSMDFGYSISKANNLRSLNGSFNFDYIVNRWGVKGYYNIVKSDQDDAEPTDRREGNASFEVFFPLDFYAKATGNFYSNNSQHIALRSTYDISLGKYFIHTNRIYLNTDIGIARTTEQYTVDSLSARNSVEAKFSIEYNMFDVGDFSILSKINLFPSISDKGRFRSIFSLTTKYDLPRDFYIKASADYQYDNKPIDGVATEDYVYTIGVGWEL